MRRITTLQGKAGLKAHERRAEAGSRRALGPPRSRLSWARAGLLACALVLALAAPAQAAPGDFDGSFANGGKLRVSFGVDPDGRAHAVALQPDGKIVAAGQAGDEATGRLDGWAVTRLHRNGSLDGSFGSAGKELIRGANGSLADVALQPDGKIVLVGTMSADILAIRLNQDGSWDRPFPGRAGFPESDETATAVAVRPDGKIVVAGTAAGRGILVARLNANGTLDTSFGDAATPGHTYVGRSASDDTTALALQPDGQIVVAALTPGPGGLPDFLIERLPADGRAGTGRFRRTIDFGAYDSPRALSLQPDGKIVVAGYSSAGSTPIARLTADGSLDDSFGDGGKRFVGAGGDPALGLALQADGKIVLAGQSFTPSTNRDHLVARLNSNGSPDGSFAAGGKRSFDLGGPDQANAVAVQPDGKIVLAGFASRDFTVVRLEGDGSVVPDVSSVVPNASVGPPSGNVSVGPPPRVDRPGRPALLPGACANTKRGTNRSDALTGTPAGDRLLGLGGNDRLVGLTGDDCLSGGSGNDRLTGGRGRNRYAAGAGRDTVNARNRQRDIVDCGPGRDRATVDRVDRVRRCERVRRIR